jgi:hypothetical protein
MNLLSKQLSCGGRKVSLIIMAECIPDRLSAKASRGEERTFALLKKLPDDYLIYYEPNIDNRHPDFIVIAPDLGGSYRGAGRTVLLKFIRDVKGRLLADHM